MRCTIVRGATFALFLLALAAHGAASASQSPSQPRTRQTSRDALIDLPYLPQTEQLCGGAALAMVLRYWGAHDVVPQDFAALVDGSEGGIRTTALTRAATDRGWTTTALNVTPDAAPAVMRREVNQGRPLIALIEERPRVYHYVVIVGLTADHVVLHDPARAPFRTVARDDFERRWSAAGRWMLLVLPGATQRVPSAAVPNAVAAAPVQSAAARTDVTACSGLVNESVSLALSGQKADAERGLLTATSLCPNDAAGWRELAGLRFVDERYHDTGRLAARAVQLSPADTNAWELLGSARFLQGDAAGALDAWNHITRPHIDTVVVEGVSRMPQPLVVRTTGLVPRQLLTRDAFLRAGRRLGELPAAGSTSVRLRPLTGGTVNVVATVAERPLVPRGLFAWASVGMNTLFARELRLDVAGLLDQGDLISGAYRFREHRPRVRFAFSVPAPGPLPGVVGIDAMWERQAYVPLASDLPLLETTRRRVGVRLSDWATGWLRWQIGGGFDRVDTRDYATVDAAVNTRWWNDRIAGILRLAHWTGREGAVSFARRDASVAFRSTRATFAPMWTAQARVISLSDAAPLLLWPIASSSDSREVLLRAHGLLDRGVITGDQIGRQMRYATVEYQRPVYISPYGNVSIAGFTDVAHASSRRDDAVPAKTQVDVGAGLRLNAPTLAGQIRMDLAYGLRTRDYQFSAGYVLPWGQ